MAPARDRACPLCLDHAENRACGLFEAKFRYNSNERFAADLLQMQPSGYNVINVRLSRAASDVEHMAGSFVDLHQCEGASAQRTKDRVKSSRFGERLLIPAEVVQL